jgi:hypothetical protein
MKAVAARLLGSNPDGGSQSVCELVRRQGLEPRTRRLRVCCSAS